MEKSVPIIIESILKEARVCYECGNFFKTVHDLMKHRKNTHKVPLCKHFLRKRCEYSSADCYYKHTANTQSQTPPKKSQGQGPTHSPGFWDLPSNLAPPSQQPKARQWQEQEQGVQGQGQGQGQEQGQGQGQGQGPTQSELTEMKTMLMQLNKMMDKFN